MNKEEAREYLMNISYMLGTTGIEYLSEKDGEKMREAIETLDQNPNIRNCFGCKYSKDNHNAGTEECHLCMWENQYTPTEDKLDKIAKEILSTSKYYRENVNTDKADGMIIALQIIDRYRGNVDEI